MLKQIINQDEESDSGENKNEGSKDSGSSQVTSTPKRSTPPSMTGSKNILSSDVEIRGKLRFSNDLIIDGRIEGEVNSEGDLTVGENAQIVGDIKTRSVVVFGKIKGNITVTDRCELKQNAELDGDVVASKLAIEEGAVFLGSSTVGKPSSISGSGSAGGNSGSPKPDGGDQK
jgi:cytoskeletal protein CcmA (bactofilin family)